MAPIYSRGLLLPACWEIFRLCWKASWPIPNSVYPSCRCRSKQAEVDGLDSKGGSTALRNALEDGSATPCDALEEQLASIWEEALGMSAISTDDNIFELGRPGCAGGRPGRADLKRLLAVLVATEYTVSGAIGRAVGRHSTPRRRGSAAGVFGGDPAQSHSDRVTLFWAAGSW
jgi:hypothetical protein